MSGAVDRATRRLLQRRVLSALLLCGLCWWFASMGGTYRMPDAWLALTILVGAILVILTAGLLVRRVAAATPSALAAHILDVLVRYAPLLVLNLMILAVVAPVVGLVATMLVNMPVLKVYLTLLGWLSSRALFWLFGLAVAGVIAVVAMRVLDRIERRWRRVSAAATVAERAVVAAAGLFCAWAVAATFNGTFDTRPGAEHRSEILRVWGIPRTGLQWADVRAWDGAGGIKRILVFPQRDGVVANLLAQGQRVRVKVRPGLLGLPWVESMHLDFEHELGPLVAEAPSAAAPRKWLIENLLRDGQWAEAARHAEAYARYHPRDRDFLLSVVSTLRDARQTQAANALGKLVVPVSAERSGR